MKIRRAGFAVVCLLLGAAAVLLAGKRAGLGAPSHAETLARLQAAGQPALVYFYSQNCPQCDEMKVILNQVRPEFSGAVTFLEVDVNYPPDKGLVRSAGIMAVPTLAMYGSDGQAHRFVGVMPADRLRERLRELP